MKRTSLLKILVPVIIAGVLASCSSSNKVASNFGKRKYTKGFFFEHPTKPDAPVGTTVAYTQPKNTELKGTPQTPSKIVFGAPVKETAVAVNHHNSKNTHKAVTTIPSKPTAIATSKTEQVNQKNNVSLKESADSHYESPGRGDNTNNGGGGGLDSHRLLMFWLISLGASILCFIIAAILAAAAASSLATTGVAAGAGLAVLFWVLGSLLSIAALVFFIMWLVALASK